MPKRRPLGTIVGGVLLIASLLLCGVGGSVLVGPAIRANQTIWDEESLGIGVVFDMHAGDDYWIYEPVGSSFPASMTCTLGDPSTDTYTVNRSGRPWSAPTRITELDGAFTYYGTLHGNRTEADVIVDCSGANFVMVPDKTPQRYLVVVLVAGAIVGLAGVIVVITGLVRRRRRESPTVQSYPGAALPPSIPVPSPVPAAPGTTASATPRGGPTRRWYLPVIPLVLVAVCACGVGGIAGSALGFTDTFDSPGIGPARSGVTGTVMDSRDEYALYADQADEIPSKDSCVVLDEQKPELYWWRAGRPLGDPATIQVNGHTYTYIGTFRTNDIIIGTVDCGDRSTLLVRPSRRSWPFVWGAVAIATLMLGAAAAIGLTTAVQRRRASAARSAPESVPAGSAQM